MQPASPTPLAELVQSLAGLHQAQHQALLDMKLEQEDRFRLLVQAQDEDRRRMEVAVNSHLKHPLILGTDWPAFTQLLGIVCADASWQTGRGQGGGGGADRRGASGPVPTCLRGNESQRGAEAPRAGRLPSGAVAG